MALSEDDVLKSTNRNTGESRPRTTIDRNDVNVTQQGRVDTQKNLAIHLDETPIRVTREILIPRHSRQTRNRSSAETEIQDSVHHPWHRHRRPRPHRHKQRIPSVTQPPSSLVFEIVQRRIHLNPQVTPTVRSDAM